MRAASDALSASGNSASGPSAARSSAGGCSRGGAETGACVFIIVCSAGVRYVEARAVYQPCVCGCVKKSFPLFSGTVKYLSSASNALGVSSSPGSTGDLVTSTTTSTCGLELEFSALGTSQSEKVVSEGEDDSSDSGDSGEESLEESSSSSTRRGIPRLSPRGPKARRAKSEVLDTL